MTTISCETDNWWTNKRNHWQEKGEKMRDGKERELTEAEGSSWYRNLPLVDVSAMNTFISLMRLLKSELSFSLSLSFWPKALRCTCLWSSSSPFPAPPSELSIDRFVTSRTLDSSYSGTVFLFYIFRPLGEIRWGELRQWWVSRS